MTEEQEIRGDVRDAARKNRFPVTMSIRTDEHISLKLDEIADYEHTNVSELVRRMVTETVHRYDRNPQFLRWLKGSRRGPR